MDSILSLYIKNNRYDVPQSMTKDIYGNSYITGYTIHQENNDKNTIIGLKKIESNAIFIKKIDNLGNIVYSTIINGDKDDYAIKILLDRDNCPYVIGRTFSSSSSLNATNKFESKRNKKSAIIIIKLQFDGLALDYLTYISGENYDEGTNMLIDEGKNLYFISSSNSTYWNKFSGIRYKHFGENLSSVNKNMVLGKLNSKGVLNKITTISSGYDTYCKAVTLDVNDKIIIPLTNSEVNVSEKIEALENVLLNNELNKVDIEIRMKGSPETIDANGRIKYKVVVENKGSNIVRDIIVNQYFLNEVLVDKVNSVEGTVSLENEAILWKLDSLLIGEIKSYNLYVYPMFTGVLESTSIVTTDNYEIFRGVKSSNKVECFYDTLITQKSELEDIKVVTKSVNQRVMSMQMEINNENNTKNEILRRIENIEGNFNYMADKIENIEYMSYNSSERIKKMLYKANNTLDLIKDVKRNKGENCLSVSDLEFQTNRVLTEITGLEKNINNTKGKIGDIKNKTETIIKNIDVIKDNKEEFIEKFENINDRNKESIKEIKSNIDVSANEKLRKFDNRFIDIESSLRRIIEELYHISSQNEEMREKAVKEEKCINECIEERVLHHEGLNLDKIFNNVENRLRSIIDSVECIKKQNENICKYNIKENNCGKECGEYEVVNSGDFKVEVKDDYSFKKENDIYISSNKICKDYKCKNGILFMKNNSRSAENYKVSIYDVESENRDGVYKIVELPKKSCRAYSVYFLPKLYQVIIEGNVSILEAWFGEKKFGFNSDKEGSRAIKFIKLT